MLALQLQPNISSVCPPHRLLPNTRHTLQARSQHLANLVFLLRHSVATSDWRRVAQLAATLLASDVRSALLLGLCCSVAILC